MISKEIIIMVVTTIVGLFLLGLVVNGLSKASCLNSYSNYQPQYSFLTGCRIMVNGVLTPTDIVRELK